MLLNDTAITEMAKSGLIDHFNPEKMGPVSYDAATENFSVRKGEKFDHFDLAPGGSVFVSTVEGIHLPANIACRVLLKNSRIREGLSLDAPLYFPGHKTKVFFRVTNVSSSTIHLDNKKGLVSLAFEQVDGPVSNPYEGAFQNEFDFRGMGSYENVYLPELSEVSKKVDDVKDVEKRLYANTLTLMGIFVAIFALVNVNVASLAGGVDLGLMLALNLATVGSIGALFGLVGLILKIDTKAAKVIPWVLAIAAFSLSIFVAL